MIIIDLPESDAHKLLWLVQSTAATAVIYDQYWYDLANTIKACIDRQKDGNFFQCSACSEDDTKILCKNCGNEIQNSKAGWLHVDHTPLAPDYEICSKPEPEAATFDKLYEEEETAIEEVEQMKYERWLNGEDIDAAHRPGGY